MERTKAQLVAELTATEDQWMAAAKAIVREMSVEDVHDVVIAAKACIRDGGLTGATGTLVIAGMLRVFWLIQDEDAEGERCGL